jgi:hypothetical protein
MSDFGRVAGARRGARAKQLAGRERRKFTSLQPQRRRLQQVELVILDPMARPGIYLVLMRR